MLIRCPGTDQGEEKLLKPPARPARLPFAAELTWQRALRKSLTEVVTSLSDFLGHLWRPVSLPVDEHHVNSWPAQRVGSTRSALFQEVMGRL